jgi:hypothetical protein
MGLMNPQDLFTRGIDWLLTALSLDTLAPLFGRTRQKRSHWHQHVERLSAEIIEVAESIQIDLQSLPRTSEVADLAHRCNACRGRTEEVAARRLVSQEALEAAIAQLHDDHRRVVDLRSELDARIAHKRTGVPVVRARKVATTTSKPGRSHWASTGLHTSSSFG